MKKIGILLIIFGFLIFGCICIDPDEYTCADGSVVLDPDDCYKPPPKKPKFCSGSAPDDYCSSDIRFTYSCKDGKWVSRMYSCEYGCEDGACLSPPQKCSDGTLIGRCSTNKPKYCSDEGSLIDLPSYCGCPSGYELRGSSCFAIKTCSAEYPVKREYIWEYQSNDYSLTLCYPKSIDYMRNRERGERKFTHFVNDPYSEKAVDLVVEDLDKLADQDSLSEYEKVEFVIAFVQAMPYTPDDVSTGYDEYERFPYETLYDDGGDCEDTSILLGAILKKMGYGVILVLPKGHAALAVKCTPSDFNDDYSVSYYNYKGYQYCYLETTGENWGIGEMPDEYKGKKVNLEAIYDPSPHIIYRYNYTYLWDKYGTDLDVCTNVKNLGSEKAENIKMYYALQTTDTSLVWDQYTTSSYDINVDGSRRYCVTNLHAPYGKSFRLKVRVSGQNINPSESFSQWYYWN
jgi:hypothetical protein